MSFSTIDAVSHILFGIVFILMIDKLIESEFLRYSLVGHIVFFFHIVLGVAVFVTEFIFCCLSLCVHFPPSAVSSVLLC